MGNIFKALNVKVDNNQLKKLIKEMDSDGSGMYEKI
jgi:Ca2+-binding EF-hand superfamily protein